MGERTETKQKVVVKVFGDSLVRGLGEPLTDSKRRTQVTCLPGKGNIRIRKEVEKSSLTEEEVAVIAVSGNDLYNRDGTVGNTECLISSVMRAVDDCKLKTSKVVVVGMLPRRGASSVAYSKNVGINLRIRDLCILEGVMFVDPYSAFYGRGDLLQRDGVHLNVGGRSKLVSLIGDACDRMIRLTTMATSSRSYASVAREGSGKSVSGNGRC